MTAQDILDVKIGIKGKKSSGAEGEKIRTRIGELQEKEGIGTEKSTSEAHKDGLGSQSTKKVKKKVMHTV